MRFSVIIPTCGRPESLRACLHALAPDRQRDAALVAGSAATSERGSEAIYEVIVTDDHPTQSGAAFVRAEAPWAIHVPGPGRGPAANRNRGARRARHDWLAFVDDDCVPCNRWLGAFRDAAERSPDTVVLEGQTHASGPRHHIMESAPINESGGYLWSCNFAVRRDLFLEMNGFDERFPYAGMEDVEFGLRLKQRGVRPMFVADATVMHPWRRYDDWWQHHRRHLKSQLIMESIHPGAGFPRPWWRQLLQYARRDLVCFLPDLWKHRGQFLRWQPILWAGQLYEIYVNWRRPTPESIRD